MMGKMIVIKYYLTAIDQGNVGVMNYLGYYYDKNKNYLMAIERGNSNLDIR
jgi:hypothetical protein